MGSAHLANPFLSRSHNIFCRNGAAIINEYQRLHARHVYSNPWVAVDAHAIVHPSGAPGEHVLVTTPQSCGVIVEDNGDLLFTLQPRFAAQRRVVEIVKGGAADGESPLECAQRELREELGIVARRWLPLGAIYEIPSIVDPPVVIFAARDLEFGPTQAEPEETISQVRMTIADALSEVASGGISDAVTMAALLRFALHEGYLAR